MRASKLRKQARRKAHSQSVKINQAKKAARKAALKMVAETCKTDE